MAFASVRRIIPAVVAWLCVSAPVLAQDGDGTPGATLVERGAYLIRAAGCVSCHTAEDGVPLAGGLALETPFGVFNTPNITPHADGLAAWTEEAFVRAVLEGRAPDGAPYYPAFPYTSYAGMRAADARAIWAYLRTVEPAPGRAADHALDFPYSIRSLLWGWRLLNFDPAPFVPDPERDARWNRGAYLSRHLGHCGECHTPRGSLGGVLHDQEYAGVNTGPRALRSPNITPHADGIEGWSVGDLADLLDSGFTPDFDVIGGKMADVVEDSTGHLTDADREAIAAYTLSVPALPDP